MVNKVILIGNVGADPEIRVLETGVKMARLRMATTEFYYNVKGERCEITQWHSIVMWRSAADLTEKYVVKGSQIYVEGKIRYREQTDPVTGAMRTTTEIIGEEIRILGRKASNQESPSATIKQAAPVVDPDGLPF